jgi:hypothetical protein
LGPFFDPKYTLYLGFEIQGVFCLRNTVEYAQILSNAPQILIA